jgi:dihydroflavonol-4-reductase
VAITLVTGGSGFLGSAITRALVERGDDVRVTVRHASPLENLEGLDVELVTADVLDRRGMRRALKGVDRVFHTAGANSLRAGSDALFRTNVDGTTIVMSEALRAGVERFVHTSSIGAIGPAPRGSTADESQSFRAGRLGLPYLNSKREAENVALRHAAQGLPVVIVNPGFTFGRGDVHRSTTEIVRRFLRRELPVYVDGAINIVDVADVARGHLLADEHGEVGERYILGNRNFTLDRLFADLGRMSGVEPPAIKLPLSAALALIRTINMAPGRPVITERELIGMAQWWAFRSTKAKRDLGYVPSPHEDTLEATIAWYRERESGTLKPSGTRQPLPLRVAGFGTRQIEKLAAQLRG